MRTGIKHLLGMFATLMLLLTVILWVHRSYAASSLTVDIGRVTIAFYNLQDSMGLYASYALDEAYPFRTRFERETEAPDGITSAIGYDERWANFGYELGRDARPDDVYFLHMIWPPWFLATVTAIASASYFRFLYRRRRARPQPTPEESAL